MRIQCEIFIIDEDGEPRFVRGGVNTDDVVHYVETSEGYVQVFLITQESCVLRIKFDAWEQTLKEIDEEQCKDDTKTD